MNTTKPKKKPKKKKQLGQTIDAAFNRVFPVREKGTGYVAPARLPDPVPVADVQLYLTHL